jgi:hypothetical protein
VEAFEVLAVVASWLPLLDVVVLHYWGSYRHHLFLGLPALVVLVGWGIDGGVEGPIRGDARRAGLALLSPWLLLQVAIAAGCFALDARYPFSDTKSAAPMLDAGAHVVADAEWRSIGMLLYRPDLQMRSASWQGRPYRYTRPDRNWHRTVPVPPLVAAECGEAPDRVYFAGTAKSLGALGRCAGRVAYPQNPFETHPFTWESFDLFRMDCACVAEAAPGP